jgi:hypothetical protein
MAQLSSAQLSSAQLSSAQLSSAQLSSAQLSSQLKLSSSSAQLTEQHICWTEHRGCTTDLTSFATNQRFLTSFATISTDFYGFFLVINNVFAV